MSRILAGPFEVAGVAGALARAQRRRGHEVQLVVRAVPPFGLPYDRLAATPAARIRTGLTAGLHHDVVHLHFNTTWCEFLDAAWWRVAGRPLVVMHVHGDDVRLRDIALREHPARGRVYDLSRRDEPMVRRRLGLGARLCAAAIAGDLELASYATTAYRTVYVVPVAVELPPPAPTPANPAPVVFHAPSDSAIKGTREIVAAMEAIAARRPLVPRMATGVPRAEVLAEIARADVVVDQLNSVTPGVFALEAMALGKPVVAEFDPARLAPAARGTPLVGATPETLEAVLEGLLDDPARRAVLGARGPAFVRDVHGADVAAASMDLVYAHARRREPGLFEVRDGAIARLG